MSLPSMRQRLAIAFGGLILFFGFVMLALAIITFAKPNESNILSTIFQDYSSLLTGILATVGVLDVIAGVLLSFPYKTETGIPITRKPTRPRRPLLFLGSLEVGIGFLFILSGLLFSFEMLSSDYPSLYTFILMSLGFVFVASGFFIIDRARRRA